MCCNRQFAAGVVIAGVLLAASYTPARAYNLSGYQWHSVGSLTFWNYTALATDRTAFGAAAQAWTNTPTPVWITAASSQGSEHIGNYSVDRNDVGWDGLTIWWNGPDGYLTYTQEKLNDHFTASYSIAERQSVSVHEYGHALGLAHTPGPVIMNGATCGAFSRWCTYSIKVPTGDDVNGVNFLY